MDQASLFLDNRFKSVGSHFITHRSGAAILPDDGVIMGFARLVIPHDGGLTLVRDSDRRDFICLNARNAWLHGAPDLYLGRSYDGVGLLESASNRQIISTEKLGDEFWNFAELHWCVLYIGELVLSYLMYLTGSGNGTSRPLQVGGIAH